MVKTNTRPDFLDEIGASVLEPLGDVSSAGGYDGFADRFRRLGLLFRDLRKPLFHLFELRFDDRDGAGQDDLVDGDKREGGIVGVKQDLVPLRDLGDQRLPIEMRLLHGLEDRPQLLAHVDLDNAQALFRHQREVGRGHGFFEGEMARHHVLDVLAKGRRRPKRQMHDAADAMAVLLEDLHVGEGFVALLDEPEMLVEPDDDVDLRRELAGELVEIVQGLLQGRAADDDGVHHDLLAGQPDLLVHIVFDEIMGDGDKA